MQKTIFLWLVLLGLCAVTLPAARAQATDPGRIVLARVTGDVSVTNKATQVAARAANAQEIAQGSIVTTPKGGSVVLVFSNGATINLKEDSVLDIEQFLQDPFGDPFNPATATDEPSVSNTKLNLTRGELVGNVKHLKKDKGSSFSVQTPVGAAGIRGTTFRIVYVLVLTGRLNPPEAGALAVEAEAAARRAPARKPKKWSSKRRSTRRRARSPCLRRRARLPWSMRPRRVLRRSPKLRPKSP